jgi:hypothetical protein
VDVSQAAQLRAPFEPEQIGKVPKAGIQLDYVGHAATTDRLLKVDPEWSWEPMAVDEHGLPLVDKAGNLWIRLTVCGVTRIGVGDGKSAKECVGDAIRNAAMRFGVALDLWAKEDLWGDEAPEAAAPVRKIAKRSIAPADTVSYEPISRPQMSKLLVLFNAAGIADREDRLAYTAKIIGREVESSTQLTESEASRLIDDLDTGASA